MISNTFLTYLQQALKTYLFSTAQRHWHVFMILAPNTNIQTYLLWAQSLESKLKSWWHKTDTSWPILSADISSHASNFYWLISLFARDRAASDRDMAPSSKDEGQLEGHSVERMYLRQRCFDGSVKKTILKPRLAAAAGRLYVSFPHWPHCRMSFAMTTTNTRRPMQLSRVLCIRLNLFL